VNQQHLTKIQLWQLKWTLNSTVVKTDLSKKTDDLECHILELRPIQHDPKLSGTLVVI
jgi:hypothetical protein